MPAQPTREHPTAEGADAHRAHARHTAGPGDMLVVAGSTRTDLGNRPRPQLIVRCEEYSVNTYRESASDPLVQLQ